MRPSTGANRPPTSSGQDQPPLPAVPGGSFFALCVRHKISPWAGRRQRAACSSTQQLQALVMHRPLQATGAGLLAQMHGRFQQRQRHEQQQSGGASLSAPHCVTKRNCCCAPSCGTAATQPTEMNFNPFAPCVACRGCTSAWEEAAASV